MSRTRWLALAASTGIALLTFMFLWQVDRDRANFFEDLMAFHRENNKKPQPTQPRADSSKFVITGNESEADLERKIKGLEGDPGINQRDVQQLRYSFDYMRSHYVLVDDCEGTGLTKIAVDPRLEHAEPHAEVIGSDGKCHVVSDQDLKTLRANRQDINRKAEPINAALQGKASSPR